MLDGGVSEVNLLYLAGIAGSVLVMRFQMLGLGARFQMQDRAALSC